MTLTERRQYLILTYFLAAVWLANSLFAKVLQFVPRHQDIVAHILGKAYARPLTLAIGIAEIVMVLWILARVRTRLNAILQIVVVATMNILEFILVPELLLWGKLNAVFAVLFIGSIYYWEFILAERLKI